MGVVPLVLPVGPGAVVAGLSVYLEGEDRIIVPSTVHLGGEDLLLSRGPCSSIFYNYTLVSVLDSRTTRVPCTQSHDEYLPHVLWICTCRKTWNEQTSKFPRDNTALAFHINCF